MKRVSSPSKNNVFEWRSKMLSLVVLSYMVLKWKLWLFVTSSPKNLRIIFNLLTEDGENYQKNAKSTSTYWAISDIFSWWIPSITQFFIILWLLELWPRDWIQENIFWTRKTVAWSFGWTENNLCRSWNNLEFRMPTNWVMVKKI